MALLAQRAPDAAADYNAYLASICSAFYANQANQAHPITTTTTKKPAITPTPIITSTTNTHALTFTTPNFVSPVTFTSSLANSPPVQPEVTSIETSQFPTASPEPAQSFSLKVEATQQEVSSPSASSIAIMPPVQTITANLNAINSSNLPTALSIGPTSSNSILYFTSLSRSSAQPQTSSADSVTSSKTRTNALLIGLTVAAGVIFALLGICLFVRAKRKRSSERRSWKIPSPNHMSQSIPPSYRTLASTKPDKIPDFDSSDGDSPTDNVFLHQNPPIPQRSEWVKSTGIDEVRFVEPVSSQNPRALLASLATNSTNSASQEHQGHSQHLHPDSSSRKHLSNISDVTYASTAASTIADHPWPDPPKSRLRPHMVIDSLLRSSRVMSSVPSVLIPSIPSQLDKHAMTQDTPDNADRSASVAQTIDYYPNPYNGQLSPQSGRSGQQNPMLRPSMDII